MGKCFKDYEHDQGYIMIGQHHITFSEITYDRLGLLSLYNRMKHCALEWNEYKTAIFGNSHVRQKLPDGFPGRLLAVYSPAYEGKHMHEYTEIQEVLSKFNFLQDLGVDDISFQINEPGFQFRKHTDRKLDYTIMFPLHPVENFNTLTFWKGEDKDRNKELEKEYDLEYSMNHPTVFNGKILHSVQECKVERVLLRIKITHESYEDMLVRYKEGTFLNA